MNDHFPQNGRTWARRFGDAFRGTALATRSQISFRVHLLAACLVVTAGLACRLPPVQWCLLALCITLVLSAEMFNTALERLAKAVDSKHNQHIADSLDVGSAAVLIAAIGASVVGATLFVLRLGSLWRWWA